MGHSGILQALLEDHVIKDALVQHILTKLILSIQIVEEVALFLLEAETRQENTHLRLRLVIDHALIIRLGVVLARLQVAEIVLVV